MTSALRGREGSWSKRDNSTDRLREWDSDKGGRGPKIRKFCGHHLIIAPNACTICRGWQMEHRTNVVSVNNQSANSKLF